MRQVAEEPGPGLSRCPAQPIRGQDHGTLTNQRPGRCLLIHPCQAGIVEFGAWQVPVDTWIGGKRGETGMNLIAFNEPEPRHLLPLLSA